MALRNTVNNNHLGDTMNDSSTSGPTRSFWVVSAIALVWNLLGVTAYLMHVTLAPEDLAAMSEEQRALYTGAPAWVTGAYAIAVFAGTLGAVGLLLRKAWAVPVFVVSLIAIVLQMGYSLLMTNVIEVMGGTAVIMPLAVIAIGIFLVLFSRKAKAGGVLT